MLVSTVHYSEYIRAFIKWNGNGSVDITSLMWPLHRHWAGTAVHSHSHTVIYTVPSSSLLIIYVYSIQTIHPNSWAFDACHALSIQFKWIEDIYELLICQRLITRFFIPPFFEWNKANLTSVIHTTRQELDKSLLSGFHINYTLHCCRCRQIWM